MSFHSGDILMKKKRRQRQTELNSHIVLEASEAAKLRELVIAAGAKTLNATNSAQFCSQFSVMKKTQKAK